MPIRVFVPIIAVTAFCAAVSSVNAGVTLDLAVDRPPVIVGSVAGEEFGYSLAAGDLDADGATDLIVGAPGHEVRAVGPNTGAVYIFSAASVVDTAGPRVARDVARVVLTGAGARSRFGQTLAIGDLDGDSVDDLVVGAPAAGGDDSIASGSVCVFLGGAPADSGCVGAAADVTLHGGAPADRLGSFVAVADIDGDGSNELIAAACRARAPSGRRSGVIYVVPGPVVGRAKGEVAVTDLAAALIVGDHDDDALGEVAVADIDGDGDTEVLVAAEFADGGEADEVDVGRVYVLPSAALAGGGTVAVAARAVSVFSGRSPRGLLGSSMAAGDVDSDGIDDLILSAPAARPQGAKLDAWGESFLAFGRPGGFGWSNDLPGEAALSFRAASRWDLFGLPVIAEDLNGDRNADIVVGAQFADSPDGSRRRCGEVSVYWGSLKSVMDAKSGSADLADLTIVGGQEMESIGGALLAASLSGGRTPDLTIGAPDARSGIGAEERTGKLYVVSREMLLRRPSRQRE